MTYLLLYKDLKAIYNAYIEKNTRSKKRKGENVERVILHSDANCFYARACLKNILNCLF